MKNYLSLIEKAMDISAFQRKVTANNVSNYNTPGFKATEVKFENFYKDQEMNVKSTNDKHIQLNQNNDAVYVEKNTQERSDGNNVDLNKEMAEMIKNNYRYNLAVSAFNKETGLIRTALGQ